MNMYRIVALGTLIVTLGLSASQDRKKVNRNVTMYLGGSINCHSPKCPDYIQDIKNGLIIGKTRININGKHVFFNNRNPDNPLVEFEYTLTGVQEPVRVTYDYKPQVEYECTCDQAVLKALAYARIKLHVEQNSYYSPTMYYEAPEGHITTFYNPLGKAFCQFTQKTK